MKRYLICASGGNAAGMNEAVIHFYKNCKSNNIEPWFAQCGFEGLYKNQIQQISENDLKNEFETCAISIGTSRFKLDEEKIEIICKSIKNNNIEKVFILGGNGSLIVAQKLVQKSINVVFIPATIDNDVSISNYSLGFDTAAEQAVKYIQNVRGLTLSHHSASIVEIMGNKNPALTLTVGMKMNNNNIIIFPNELNTDTISNKIQSDFNNGKKDSIVLVQEKMVPEQHKLLKQIAKETWTKTGIMVDFAHCWIFLRGGITSEKDKQMAEMFINKAFEGSTDTSFVVVLDSKGIIQKVKIQKLLS